jgi:uncharacterized membrane protein
MGTDPLEGVLEAKDKLEDALDLKHRRRVMGLPIGSKQTDWSKVAKVGAGAAAVGAAALGVTKLAQKLNLTEKLEDSGLGDTLESGKGTVKDALSGAGDAVTEPLQQGKETVQDALNVGGDLKDKASSLGDAVSGEDSTLGKLTAAFGEISSWGDDDDDDGPLKKQRLIISEQVDVAVPRPVAYNQWTQFEDFPSIFQGVQRVQQQDDDRTQWTGKILFASREWEAEILEQAPDERIVWETSGDVEHRGVVTFHRLDDNLTRVQIEMEYIPSGVLEKVGNLFLTARHRVRKDLRLFKHYLELRGEETGAWRGEISKEDEDEASGDEEDPTAGEEQDSAGDAGDESSGDDPSGDEGDADDSETPPRDDSGRFVSQEEAEAS